MERVEIYNGKYLYRCKSCGFEHPVDAVPLDKLGSPPAHSCKESKEVRFEAESE